MVKGCKTDRHTKVLQAQTTAQTLALTSTSSVALMAPSYKEVSLPQLHFTDGETEAERGRGTGCGHLEI